MPSLNRLLLLVLTALVIAVLVIVARGYPPPSSGVPPAATVAVQPGPPTTPSAPAPSNTPWPASPPTSAPPASVVSTVSRVPDSLTAVVEQVGGFPAEWSKRDEHGRTVGDNGWIHRGMQQLHFRVPAGCAVDVGPDRFFADAQIDAANFTMYWL